MTTTVSGSGRVRRSNVAMRSSTRSCGKPTRPARRPGNSLARPVGSRGARLGRGHVTSRLAGRGLGSDSRRVAIKTRLVNLAKAGPRSLATHLRYLEREGVDRQGGAGQAYGPDTDIADLDTFQAHSADDRHQFRMIVSPEDAESLDDLRTYTRQLMTRMEADLGTRLEWVAVDHWNTDNPHTHVVLRGKDDTGKDLIIARGYIAEGMRQRACELATEWLGPRTELELQTTLQRQVGQARWTGLDRTLQREARDGLVTRETLAQPRLQRHRQLLIGRLQQLQSMGLATEQHPGTWAIHGDAEQTLRTMGERGDIIRTLQRAMVDPPRELVFRQPGEGHPAIVGRVAAKGLVDELHERGYLIVDGLDGKAHYVPLSPGAELGQYPTGAVIEIKGTATVRAADRAIAEMAVDGIYRTDHHLAAGESGQHDHAIAHVRRLEALRRAGIVERVGDGLWRVPPDLPERGRHYDAQRTGGYAVELKSHLPIERQARVIGATWLDQQLIGGGTGLGDIGFGAEAKEALQRRVDFLVEEGLARRSGQQLILARNLLANLRNRELADVARGITAQTGLEHRPVAEGQPVRGIYRRNVQLASGRFAMLDDGAGFSLVPWRPVIDKHLGQQLAATVRGSGVSWVIGRQKGLSV